jgi:predicted nucleic acid-binding protein
VTSTGPIICDTSGLIALADAADPDHAAVTEVVESASGPFVVSPLVVAEVDHLLRARCGVQAARTFADDLAGGAFELAPTNGADIGACVDLDRHYADLGLADAHLVVLAEVFRTTALLSLDERHLRAVRPLRGRGSFRLLPADREP